MDNPNIVLILSDQHNANVLGFKGDKYIKTPNLDKLSENGVNFNNCYCASPLCVPSRMSLLTGQVPFKTEVFNNHQSLHSDRATIAHTMNASGYETVLAGRMHFTGEDQHHGFEQRLVGDVTPFYQGYDFLKESFEELFNAFLPGPAGFKKNGPGMSSIYHYDNDVVEETKNLLNKRDNDRPLFLTVGLSAPHPPFICEKEVYDHYYDILPDVEVSEFFEENKHQALIDFAKLRKMELLEKEDIKRIRAGYYGLVEFMDKNIGKIIDSIDKTLGLDNTIIIYTSDHGEHLGLNNLIFKGTFLENSVKVPLIISYPEKYLQNVSIEDPVSLLDITKTIVETANADELPGMDGVSLTKYLNTENYKANDRVIISQIGPYPRKHVPTAMIRKGKFKMIAYHGYENPSLFDLSTDPEEICDLGSNSSYSDIITELKEELSKKWDGEKVIDFCNKSNEHYKIIDKWSHATRYKKRDNWKSVPNSNYVD